MRIVEAIYLVGDGMMGMSHPSDCHVYIVDLGESLLMIDAGVGVKEELILRNIEEDGFDPKRIDTLLLTHSHADHAGGARFFKEAVSCQVMAPEGEARIIEAGTEEELGLDITKRNGLYAKDYVFPHCDVDRSLRDGEEISFGGYKVTVIQVAGHSPAASCFLLETGDYRALFSGDVVFLGGNIGLGNWPGSCLSDYRKNIKKLAELSVGGLFPGHWLWTIRDGQKHLDMAIENMKLVYPPPNFQHNHPCY